MANENSSSIRSIRSIHGTVAGGHLFGSSMIA